MNIDNLTKVGSTSGLTKYEHPDEAVVGYEIDGYGNDPTLFIRRIGEQQWVSVIHTYGSFTTMKASNSDFSRALNDGKRLIDQFAQ